MGKVLEKIERHLDTDDYISLLHWYIKECAKLEKEYIEAKNDITQAFNARRKEFAENV